MADSRLSSQAGPVDIMYELDDSVLRPPVPPKNPHDHEPEADTGNASNWNTQSSVNGYEGQQQQVGNNINRSQSGYAPQVTEVKTTVPPTIPESTVSSPSPVSPHPSMMYGASPDTNLPSDSYSQNYQLTQSGDSNISPTNYAGSEASYAAPQYSTPISGYYAPVQYNPEQSYGIQQGPYLPQSPPQSPPPIKPEFSLYGNQVPSPAVPPSAVPPPPPPPVAAAPDGEQKMKKRICGMTVTLFSLLCVALFVVIAGAVLGGVFGSGVLKKGGSSSENSSNDPTSVGFPTSFITRLIPEPTPEPTPTDSNESTTTTTTTIPTTVNNFAYPIPSGTWTLSAPLQRNTGSCINNLSDTNYKEVWYCPDNKTQTIVIKDFSSVDKYMYTLDIDTPVRRRGVQGLEPNGTDVDNGDRPFWQFEVPYMGQAFGQTGCELRMSLLILLGRTKNLFAFAERAYAPDSCVLPHGGNSTAGIGCMCIYLNGGET